MVVESENSNICENSLKNISILLLTLLLLFGTASTVSAEIPPAPLNLNNSSQGNFWINYTWSLGIAGGNVTDNYNVSINGVWVNDSLTAFNNSSVGAHNWSNITLYAYNNTGAGNLSLSANTSQTQVSNNVPVLGSIGDKTVTAGDELTFTISATDADSDTLTNASNNTNGSFTPSTGVYSWTPTAEEVGTYIWEFNTSDIYSGLDNETITVTVQAASTTSGGSGGSTGGAGVSTSESFDNIEKAERHDKTLFADRPSTYTFTATEHGVSEIVVTGDVTESNIALRVEALKGTSTSVSSSAPGAVYKNINVWVGTKNIKEAIIRFKVENSWLESENIPSDKVKMVRWNGGKWADLDTTQKTKDNSYTYYEAKTGEFSSFAIVGLKEIEAVPTEVKTTAKPTVVTTSAEEITPASEATEDEETPGFGVVAFISAMALMVAVRNRERR